MSGDMRVFEHFSPGKIIGGSDSLSLLPELVDSSKKHLLMTDPGLAQAGLSKRVVDVLADAGIKTAVFDRVEADPPIENVLDAAEFAREKKCHSLIALGGGSSIDAAKAVCANLGHPDIDLRTFGAGKSVVDPVPDLIAIPTTAGTGSEATRVAVITDKQAKVKMAIRGDCLLPKAALLDPNLLDTLPSATAAETGADALTHAIEAYVSNNSNPMTDALAIEAIRIIGRNLKAFCEDRSDKKAALNMLIASNLAGQAFTNAGLGLVHSMAEPLGAYCHVSHGLACAIYLPVIMSFNVDSKIDRFAHIANALGRDITGLKESAAAKVSVEAVLDLFNSVSIPLDFQSAKIDFSLNEKMLDEVPGQFSTRCNPRQADRKELEALYRQPEESRY